MNRTRFSHHDVLVDGIKKPAPMHRRVFALLASSMLAFSSFPVSLAIAQGKSDKPQDETPITATTSNDNATASDANAPANPATDTKTDANAKAGDNNSANGDIASGQRALPERALTNSTLLSEQDIVDSSPVYIDKNSKAIEASEMDVSEASSMAGEYDTSLSDIAASIPSEDELEPSNPFTEFLSALASIPSLFGANDDSASPFSKVSLRWLTKDSASMPDFNDSHLSVFYNDRYPSSVSMRFEAVLSGNDVYETGKIRLAIPKGFLTGRDGKEAGKMSFSVPQAPSTLATFAYTELDDCYILQNCVPLASGSSITIDFSVKDIVPYKIVSGSNGKPVTATISLANSDVEPVTAGPLTSSFETHAFVNEGTTGISHTATTNNWFSVPNEFKESIDTKNYSCMTFYSWTYIYGSQPYNLTVNAKASIAGSASGETPIVLGAVSNGGIKTANAEQTDTFSTVIGRDLTSLDSNAATFVTTYVAVPRNAAPAGKTCNVSLDLSYIVNGVDGGSETRSTGQATKAYLNPTTRGSSGHFGVHGISGGDVALALNRLERNQSTNITMGAESIEMLGASKANVNKNELWTDYDFATPMTEQTVNANPDDLDIAITAINVSNLATYTWREFETSGYGYGPMASEGYKYISAGEYGYAPDGTPHNVRITFYDAPDYQSANAFSALGSISYDNNGKVTTETNRAEAKWEGRVLRLQGQPATHVIAKATYDGDGIVFSALQTYTFRPTANIKEIVKYHFENSDSPYVRLTAYPRVAIKNSDDSFLSTDSSYSSGSLSGSSTFVSAETDTSGLNNDVNAKTTSLSYKTTVYEQTNITNLRDLTEAQENDMTFNDLRGVWRVLLHEGMEVDMSSILVGDNSDIKNAYVMHDFKNSGRDMLVVEVTNMPKFTYQYNCGRDGYGDKRTLSFTIAYSWQAHELFGDEVECVTAYESLSDNFGSVNGYRGEPDTPAAYGNYSSYYVHESVGTLLNDLSNRPKGEPRNFVYALSQRSLGVDTYFVSGYSKQVAGNGQAFANEAVISEKTPYSYRLSYSNGAGGTGTVENLVFYDVVESAGDWRGTFQSVDVSAVKAAGANPVVYYSTRNIDLQTAMNTALTDKTTWTTTPPTTGTVNAIAVDATKALDGSAFSFDSNKELWVTIRMIAPMASDAYPADPARAYATSSNPVSARNKSSIAYTLNGQKKTLDSNETAVKLSKYELNGSVAFDDEDDNDRLRPHNVTVRLMRNGQAEGHQLTWASESDKALSGTWTFDFNKAFPSDAFPASDADGNPYYYAYEVCATPEGAAINGYSQKTLYVRSASKVKGDITLVHEPETLLLAGEKKWDAPGGTSMPNSVDLRIPFSATQSYYVEANATNQWQYQLNIPVKKYENGQKKDYVVTETTYVPGFVSHPEGLNVTNTYYPYADLTLTHEVGNDDPVSKTALDEAHSSFYVFIEKDGAPSPITITGKIGNESVEVTNGSAVDVAPGKSLKFTKIPSDITVKFVRDNVSDGWTATGQNEQKVTLRAGDEKALTFTSTYSASGKHRLNIEKVLNGQELTSGMFLFEMLDENDRVISTGRNDEKGQVFLPNVTATEADEGKDIVVKIRERKDDSKRGYAWDTSAWLVTLRPKDNGHGVMEFADISYKKNNEVVTPKDNKIVFTNTYSATGDLYITAWKTLEGMTLKDHQFTFQLADKTTGNVIATAQNNAEGVITFGPIHMNQSNAGKTYEYVASEIAGDEDGITYDTRKFDYTVTVSDKKDGTLGFETVTEESPVFKNIGKPGSLAVTKQVTDDAVDAEDSKHRFRITLSGNDFYAEPYAALYGDVLVLGRGDIAQGMYDAELTKSWKVPGLEGEALVTVDEHGVITDDQRPWRNNLADVKHVVMLDGVSPESTAGWFQGMENLIDADMNDFYADSIKDARGMFMGCKSLISVYTDDPQSWDSIANVEGIFADCNAQGLFSGLFGGADNITFADVLSTKPTVNYDSNGGNIMPDATVRINPDRESVYSAFGTPTKMGYRFEGWYTDSECTHRVDDSAQAAKTLFADQQEITLYAGWEQQMMRFKFMRDALCDEEYEAEYGEEVGQLDDASGLFIVGYDEVPWEEVSLHMPDDVLPCPEGYYYIGDMYDWYWWDWFEDGMTAQQIWEFGAWYYDWEFGTGEYDGTAETLPNYNGEVIGIYMTYETIHYNIEYISNDRWGSTWTNGWNWYNSTVGDHYASGDGDDARFDGWYTQPEGGTKVANKGDWPKPDDDVSFTVAEVVAIKAAEGDDLVDEKGNPSITLYGHWTPISKPLHFETNGGTQIDDIAIRYSEKINFSEYIPTRDGYSFSGWYPTNECKVLEKITGDFYGYSFSRYSYWGSNEEFTVYAGWKPLNDDNRHGIIGSSAAPVEWEVDANNTLILRPSDGRYGELSDGAHPWLNEYQCYIESLRVEPGVGTTQGAYLDELFANLYYLKTADVANLDLSKARSIYHLFYNAWVLQDVDVSSLETSSITQFNGCFASCYALTNIDVSNWDVSNGTNFTGMFQYCSKLTFIDVSRWDTSKAVYINDMFSGCSNLEQVDVSGFNVENVYTASYMFSGCSKLTNIDIRNWNLKNANSIGYLFNGCSSLTDLGVSGMNVSSVYYFGSVFAGCRSLTELDLSSWNVNNATYMYSMFSNCSSLQKLVLDGWSLPNVYETSYMFQGCSSLKTIDLTPFSSTKPQFTTGMFQSCTNLETIDLSPLSFMNVINASNMFSSCSSLKTLDFGDETLENVTEINGMFSGCKSITSLDLSNWNTSKVRRMYDLFSSCTSLVDLNVVGWDTTSVINAGDVFKNVSAMKQLDLTGWTFPNLGIGISSNYSDYYCCNFYLPQNLDQFILSKDFVRNVIPGKYASSFLPYYQWGEFGNYWTSDDAEMRGPYKTDELYNLFKDEPARVGGTWRKITTGKYHVSFEGGTMPDNDFVQAVGSMKGETITIERRSIQYVLPTEEECGFYAFGYKPVGWRVNGSDKIYNFGETFASYISDGQTITITPAWEKDAENTPERVGNTITFALRPGETYVLDGVAPGTSYMVEELTQAGWHVASTEPESKNGVVSGTIVADGLSQVTFTNAPGSAEDAEFTIAGTKTLDGSPAGGYEFELCKEDEVLDTVESDENGAFSFVVSEKYDTIKEGSEYIVREVQGDDTGVNYDSHEATVHVFDDEGYVTLEGTEELAFENTLKPAMVLLSQEVPEGANADAEFVYTVKTGPQPGDEQEVTLIPSADPVEIEVTPEYAVRVYPKKMPAGFTSEATDDGLIVLPDGVHAGDSREVALASTYKMSGKAIIPVNVSIKDADLVGADFSFAMVPHEEDADKLEQDNVTYDASDSATNSENGVAAFVVSYTGELIDPEENGIRYLVTQETRPLLDTWLGMLDMDGTEHEITVAWQDNGDGTAEPVITFNNDECALAGAALFKNSIRTVDVMITKETLGVTNAAASARFPYVLTIERPARTEKVSDETFDTDEVLTMQSTVSASKPDVYTIIDENGEEKEFTNGDTIEFSSENGAAITVRGVPLGSKYNIVPAAIPSGFDDTELNRADGMIHPRARMATVIPLLSSYESTGVLEIHAALIARGFTPEKDQFTFTAKRIIDGVAQNAQKAGNADNESIKFPLHDLTAGDDEQLFVYELSQDPVADDMYKTDPLRAKVTVSAHDDGLGNMTAKIVSIDYEADVPGTYLDDIDEHLALSQQMEAPVEIVTSGIFMPFTGTVPWIFAVSYIIGAPLIFWALISRNRKIKLK